MNSGYVYLYKFEVYSIYIFIDRYTMYTAWKVVQYRLQILS